MSQNQPKKTITLPKSILRSILIGVILSILIVFGIHLSASDKFFANTEQTGNLPMNTKVYSFGFTCPINKNNHSFLAKRGETLDDTIADHFSTTKLDASFFATFEEHWGLLFILTLSITLLMVVVKKYRFRLS